jgi:hypothetical protein
MRRQIIASIHATALVILLVACGANTVGPGTYSVTPGSAAVIGFDNYTCGDSLGSNPSTAADNTESTLQSDGWNTTTPIVDTDTMTSSQFTADMSVNALFYFGHGFTGVVAFPGICGPGGSLDLDGEPPYYLPYYWGVGDIANEDAKATGALPSSGSNLEWMFLFSSDTVAPEAVEDPLDAGSTVENQEYVANPWEPLFYQANLPLRGLYGYWQSYGQCPEQGSGQRNCDVTANNNWPVASTLFTEMYQGGLSSTTIPDAWQQANESNNESGAWSEQLDTGTANDHFSGGSNGVARSGALQFYDELSGAPSGALINVASNTGTLTPYNMVNESLNVSGAVATGDSDFSAGTYTTKSNGSTTTYTSVGGLQVNYYQGTSGGVTYQSETLHNAMSISESTAEAAAVSFIDNSFGMPSDAVLVDTLSLYTLQNNGSAILTGYEFVWNHSGGQINGGDAIKVDVEDYSYDVKTCTAWIYNDPPLKNICTSWEYVYHNEPNVSFGYRLWRSIGSAVSTTKTGYTAGRGTVDAYTASLALPVPNDVTGYQLGYWVTSLTQPTGIAEPAWIYSTTDGRIYGVDAGSGALLGSESQ